MTTDRSARSWNTSGSRLQSWTRTSEKRTTTSGGGWRLLRFYCKYSIYYSVYSFLVYFSFPRIMVMENVNKPQLWNIFNQVTMQSQDVRHHRFCLRLMLKNPDNHALCVLNGHNAFVSGSFKHALGNVIHVLILTNIISECFLQRKTYSSNIFHTSEEL